MTARDPLGDAPCPGCRRMVYFAWDADMVPVALEPDDDGGVVVAEDLNRIPWCRPDDGGQLTLEDRLYRLHDPACPALAPVIPLTSRRPSRHPLTGGRRASG